MKTEAWRQALSERGLYSNELDEVERRARELTAAQPSASDEAMTQSIHCYVSEHGGYTIGVLREALQRYAPSPQQSGTRKVTDDNIMCVIAEMRDAASDGDEAANNWHVAETVMRWADRLESFAANK